MMATGAPLPVREYTDAREMQRRAAELRRACFAPKNAVATKPVSPITRQRRDWTDDRIAATIAVYGKPDMRSVQQREGRADYSGRYCLTLVSRITGFTLEEIAGDSRAIPLSKARAIVCHLMSRFAGKSTLIIGEAIDRDHTTVLHAQKRARAAVAELGLSDVFEPGELATALWSAEWPAHTATRALLRAHAKARPC